MSVQIGPFMSATEDDTRKWSEA